MKRVEITSREKQYQRPNWRERAKLLTQPTMPPTRKPTATITVIQAEASTGKIRASTPSTSINTPSNRVKAFNPSPLAENRPEPIAMAATSPGR